jgi:hypothetical protein
MANASRAAGLAAALVLVAGCGASVADNDRPAPTRPARAPAGDFCAAVQANTEAARPLAGLARGGAGPADLEAVAAEVRRTGSEVLATAPGEIRTDVERSVEAANLQLDALEATGGDPVAAARDTDLTERLNAPEFAAAAQRVRAYVAENCTAGSG